MNVTNIKLRGALGSLDTAAKQRMNKIVELTKANQFAQLNTAKFDSYVETVDRLVHEIEVLRLEFNAALPKPNNGIPGDELGVEVR